MDRKKIETAVAALVIIIFIFIAAGSVMKIRAKLQAKAQYAAANPGVPVEANRLFAERKEMKSETEAEVKETGQERDPFGPSEVASAPTASSDLSLKLTGITSITKGKAMAIINGNLVSVGGKVGNLTVVDISSHKVTLTDGKKDLVLNLK